MITREEALRRLDAVAHELVTLRAALAEGWTETPVENPTQAFRLLSRDRKSSEQFTCLNRRYHEMKAS
jgi:hypothetical protein